MAWLVIAGLTLSSSLDNLGVGMSYGIRSIEIRKKSNLIIATVCFLFSYVGIWFGKWISQGLPGALPAILAAFILVIIGLRIILLATPRKQKTEVPFTTKENSCKLSEILQNPESFDKDKSNDIDIWEAFLLGVALSANALTNGLSAGLLHLSPFLISLLAALGSFVSVSLGVWLGNKVTHVQIGKYNLGQFGTLISGILLVLISVGVFL